MRTTAEKQAPTAGRRWFDRHGKRLAATMMILSIYLAARSPVIGNAERGRLAGRFQFSHRELPTVTGPAVRNVRPVNPSLDHISAWISSVGASIALSDLDGDQRPNDVCYVDVRNDQVIVAPAPIEENDGSTLRYTAFALEIGADLFDRRTMAPTGCLPGDLNEDGSTDLLVYFWGRTPIAFLRRRASNGSSPQSAAAPAATFSAADFVACEIGPPGERWYTNAATRADVDGDGHVDLIIGNYFQDGARILDAQATNAEEMQDSMSRAFNGGRNRLLLWDGAVAGDQPAVRFRDQPDVFDIAGEPVATGWTLAIGAADLDGDLLPEIYVGNDFGPDRLLHNRSAPGEPRFALLSGRRGLTTPSSKVLGHDSFKGMGVDFGDLNGDGQLDIYVSNIAAEYALEESHFVFLSQGSTAVMREGRAPYVDRSEALGLSRSGWGWETRLADFDNDGVLEAMQATGFVKGRHNRWPELHEVAMGNDALLRRPQMWHRFQPGDDLSGHDHNPFFVRSAGGRYVDIAADIGVDQPQVSRGIATADVDRDGAPAFAVANQWVASRFYV